MESSASHLGQRGIGYLVRLPIVDSGTELQAGGDDEV